MTKSLPADPIEFSQWDWDRIAPSRERAPAAEAHAVFDRRRGWRTGRRWRA